MCGNPGTLLQASPVPLSKVEPESGLNSQGQETLPSRVLGHILFLLTGSLEIYLLCYMTLEMDDNKCA